MTPKTIKSPEFKKLLQSFSHWLATLNYSKETITTRNRNVKEFLLYLERCNINTIEALSDTKAQRFRRYLKRRENKLFGSGLMSSSINVGIGSVNKFFEYLQETRQLVFKPLEYVTVTYKPKTILSLEEIAILYKTTHQTHHFAAAETQAKQEAVSQRDRAMLSIYYGCGLRKSEGVALLVSDILKERRLLHVRKGKGSKERLIPITGSNYNYILDYLQDGRLLLQSYSEAVSEHFFISQYGTPCGDQALIARLKRLVKNSGNTTLQQKKPSLHSLRHSIATHLLQKGMEIELIQQFLGHSSLESTQIYTHIVHEF